MKVDGTLLDPLRQLITDKEYVKLYVSQKIGDKYNVKTFDILRKISEIDDYDPIQFPCVVKPTHASGMINICHSPEDFPKPELLKHWMQLNYYAQGREQNYKFLKPKIMVEEFISGNNSTVPFDYKVYCFHGRPHYIHVDSDRFKNPSRNYYDTGWHRLNVEWGYPNRHSTDPKPENLSELLQVASALSAPFDFIRVDCYVIGTDLRVGELTNCPARAGSVISPREMESELCYW